MAVLGMLILVPLRPEMVIWQFSNGLERMAVLGMNGPVPMRPKMVIWQFSNGLKRMAVLNKNFNYKKMIFFYNY
jgi:hypothetical protein